MLKKIALEENVLTPGLIDYWRPTVTEIPAPLTAELFKRLSDYGELRMETMDKAGFSRAALPASPALRTNVR